jgi:hypothetical protein
MGQWRSPIRPRADEGKGPQAERQRSEECRFARGRTGRAPRQGRMLLALLLAI